MPASQTICCYKCKHVWSFEPPLGRRHECPHCHADAKVCLNCRYYDKDAYHECREEQAEWVKEKTQGNFCGWFEPLANQSTRDAVQDSAKSKLDSLFGGASSEPVSKPGGNLKDELAKFLSSKK